MSKAQQGCAKEPQSEWRPLDIRQLEKFQTLEIENGSPGGRPDEDFRLLYEGGPRRETEGEFRPVHRTLIGMNPEGEGSSDSGSGQSAPERKKNESEASEAMAAADLKKIEQQAYAEGFAKGERDGLAAGKKQAETMAASLQTLLTDVDGLWRRMVTTYEKEILGLIFRIAEKVVMGQVRSDSETVKRSILKAFEIIPEPKDVTIKVHPDDYEYIELIKEDIFVRIKELRQVELVADHSVKRGGCVIETRSGNVVVDIEKRLESVQASMMEANRIRG